ncbi:HAMP domain-containing histidine kinase [Coleofasciculus sp. FACHB-712]|uniref:sensor histidine kinase n=1 Tax=Cyanophyceae TaxID=3028117 RepID=UPI001683FBFC|nr:MULTISPECIES: HAMP domain-containing sensor histidine kinase [unclassified Coleofasciculus]MBD1889628.1 HAMP domain-containing histidine kinase [Coleofasciculus sp. FACHB-SPT9]MBD1941330.1 HAMP domain-containing histidine kinase [Coleofasciculus sp. FACHB-712]
MQKKWLLPTISEILAQSEHSEQTGANSVMPSVEQTAEKAHGLRPASRTAREYARASREWCGAIAALEQLLLQVLEPATDSLQDSPQTLGLILAGPVPVLSHPAVMTRVHTGIFTAERFNPLALMPFLLPPATTQQKENEPQSTSNFPLIPADPLTSEQFCVIFTPRFSLVMVVGEDITGAPAFQYSFDPQVVEQAWQTLRSRLLLTSLHQVSQLETLVERFAPQAPDYRTVMQFSRLLLKHLPEEIRGDRKDADLSRLGCGQEAKGKELEDNSELPILNPKLIENSKFKIQNSNDVELLQAFAHEVRTPLSTIRTLTRLLLKRRNELAPDIIRRLEAIDRECTEQIDRMELFFRAVELETETVKRSPVHLTAMSVAQVFQNSIPRWQKQANRRNLTLEVVLPQKLPAVVSNPAMLDQVLTGLIENFTRSIPAGGHIQVEVTPAGDQLKLQLQSQNQPDESGNSLAADNNPPTCKSIGQLLMFQPETGCLSLNLNVTKNLFQALGGKLIVRQRPQQGEVMTVFLPLDVDGSGIWNA